MGSADDATEEVGEEESTPTDLPEGSPGVVDCASIDPDGPVTGPEPLSPLGFPEQACDPSTDTGAGSPYRCCSSDPTMVEGVRVFSGDANDQSRWGACVQTELVPASAGLPENGCPVPCNPTASAAQTEATCGAGALCCQAFELTAADCVEDGEGWRPATGADVPALTSWDAQAHDTHQDPGLVACEAFAAGDPARLEACVAQLGVANQRGFCLAGAGAVVCPAAQPSYVDACEALNE
ncbi:hypothetical protein PPSIR1_17120 [Plesiocystis pacifica SIR-1]|uniref:Uncharacterized protein n=2 Tax=Plesiocystis pacifica TaxID=191768 RepID=A6GIA4_9BACT|nr:hypothetical protein PPSIR1_17120 [Plesiocystis pacifica SIR-1]